MYKRQSLPSYVAGSQDLDTCTVTAGDTLWIISRRYGVDPTALARANGLNVNALLPAGAQIQVPGRLVRVNALLSHVAQQAEVEPGLVKACLLYTSRPRHADRRPGGAGRAR